MKRLSIFLINLYQNTPIHTHTHCRFIPTCSEYMKIKIQSYGFIKGTFMGLKRILRCNPFGKSGIDL